MPSTGHGSFAPNDARVLLTPADMRDPWMSVYGFPTIAGRLAGGEELLLVCRRDELSAFVNQLNVLVGAPATLQRAGAMVRQMTAGAPMKAVTALRGSTIELPGTSAMIDAASATSAPNTARLGSGEMMSTRKISQPAMSITQVCR